MTPRTSSRKRTTVLDRMASAISNGNGYVSRKEVIGVAGLVITCLLAFWAVHVQQPHKGALSNGEFERFCETRDSNINSRFDRIERRQDRISDKIDGVLEKLGNGGQQ